MTSLARPSIDVILQEGDKVLYFGTKYTNLIGRKGTIGMIWTNIADVTIDGHAWPIPLTDLQRTAQ